MAVARTAGTPHALQQIAMRILHASVLLFRLFDIPVRAHWSWFCFPFSTFLVGGWFFGEWTGVAVAFGLLCLMMVSALAHEFAHCLTARLIGCGTHDILLIPFGIVAHLHRIPREPLHEVAIVGAGPFMSVCLAVVAWVGSLIAKPFVGSTGFAVQAVCYFLLFFNGLMAAFNLLVAILPTDGGRILRATIFAVLRRWSRLDDYDAHLLATKIAVRGVGWPLGVILFVAALMTEYSVPSLFILLPLLCIGGELELWMVREFPDIFEEPDTLTFLPRAVESGHSEDHALHPRTRFLPGMELVLSYDRASGRAA